MHPSKSLIEDYHSRNGKEERKKEERILEDSFSPLSRVFS